MLCLLQAADKDETPDLKISRMCGVQPVAVLFERRPRSFERCRTPAQVARGKCDLGFGDDAPSTCHGFPWTEGICGFSQEFLRACKLTELRHRDAAQREGRRIVAQSNPLQCAERVTRCKRLCRGCGH